MSDPFELRLIFSNRLKALNPCEDNADEVVGFALKHRELAEDFHSCILEQLENVSNPSVLSGLTSTGRE
jgi:CTD kinase subunit gamma